MHHMQFVGHGRIPLDDDNFKRLTKKQRSFGDQVFAPMNDGTMIFYQNITMIIPDGKKVYAHSWESYPYVGVFLDGYKIGLSEDDFRQLGRAIKRNTYGPYVVTSKGVFVFHGKLAMLTSIDSEFIRERKIESCCDTNSEIRSFENKYGNVQYANQCTECGKKKLVKASLVENPESVKPILEIQVNV